MSNSVSQKNSNQLPGFRYIKTVADIDEYILKSNGLRVLFHHRPHTGVVTTNITYRVGSRDEQIGETGLAHMLEHMLFKPTSFDVARGTDAAAMVFERETGCILNANTWRDRTTYFFCYPTSHFNRAIAIEAERMTGVILTSEELVPEQKNVLSEFDMYNGDPEFALSVQMSNAAFTSHPYHHETIGFREDIESYTTEKVERFYRLHYRPNNATLMIIGDIDKRVAARVVKEHFGSIPNPEEAVVRSYPREPKQEGIRRTSVVRPSATNLLHIGFKHEGFPSPDWYTASIAASVIANGPESLLHRLLVDTGKASNVACGIEPTSDRGLGVISITLAPGHHHDDIEQLVLRALKTVPLATLTPLVKKVKAATITKELFARDSSLKIASTLTEYVASDSWETYGKTIAILDTITPAKVHTFIIEACTESNLTIGTFVGTNS